MVLSYKPYTFLQNAENNKHDGGAKESAEEKKKGNLICLTYWSPILSFKIPCPKTGLKDIATAIMKT